MILLYISICVLSFKLKALFPMIDLSCHYDSIFGRPRVCHSYIWEYDLQSIKCKFKNTK